MPPSYHTAAFDPNPTAAGLDPRPDAHTRARLRGNVANPCPTRGIHGKSALFRRVVAERGRTFAVIVRAFLRRHLAAPDDARAQVRYDRVDVRGTQVAGRRIKSVFRPRPRRLSVAATLYVGARVEARHAGPRPAASDGFGHGR